jgi:hypothetical protein
MARTSNPFVITKSTHHGKYVRVTRREGIAKRLAPVVKYLSELLDDQPWLSFRELVEAAVEDLGVTERSAKEAARRANYTDVL